MCDYAHSNELLHLQMESHSAGLIDVAVWQRFIFAIHVYRQLTFHAVSSAREGRTVMSTWLPMSLS